MRIFILEDDDARILAFEHTLKMWDLPSPHEVTIRKWVHGPRGAMQSFRPPYDLILLDHDLGGRVYVDSSEEETGFTFVKELGKREAEFHGDPKVIIHSWNPDGAKAMQRVLQKNMWRVITLPFGKELLLFLEALK